MTKKKTKKTRKNIGVGRRLSSGVVELRAGCVQGAQVYTTRMTQETRAKFQIKRNSYWCISSPEHGTLVYRQIKQAPYTGACGLGYLYLDEKTLDMLNVGLHDPLVLRPADFDLEIP